MQSSTFSRGLLIAALVLFGIVGRILAESVPNLTPVAAAALFAGFVLQSRRRALLVPLLAMLATDLLYFGLYDVRIMAVVYLSFFLPVLFGPALRARLTAFRVAAAASLGSVAFFVATNVAVWAFGGIYPTTTAGLGRCFAAALPFFRYTISGDLIFAAGLFGTYALARHWRRSADFKPLPSAVTA